MAKQLRKSMRLLAVMVGVALLLVAGTCIGASAAPLTFVWNPLGASPPLIGGPIGPANNFNVADFASVTLAGSNFTEVGYLSVLQFLNGGVPAPSTNLGTTYSLYIGFNGTGAGQSVPGPGLSSTGFFNSLDYTLFGIASPTPTFTVTNGNVTVAPAGAFPLAFGSLVSGTTTLTNTGVGTQPFSPTANLFETFHICTAPGQGNTGFGNALCTGNESAFFVSPPPSTINLLVGNFSATTSVTTFDGTHININGGGGNLTFENRVPEPMSLLLMGVGVLGLAGLRRMRTGKR